MSSIIFLSHLSQTVLRMKHATEMHVTDAWTIPLFYLFPNLIPSRPILRDRVSFFYLTSSPKMYFNSSWFWPIENTVTDHPLFVTASSLSLNQIWNFPDSLQHFCFYLFSYYPQELPPALFRACASTPKSRQASSWNRSPNRSQRTGSGRVQNYI